MGGDAILEALQDHLGVHAGETTADGRVTLEHIECNAACDYAPVVMVNWEFFDNQTPSSARDLVDGLREGQPPLPTRGAPLCTFKETARVLAGLPDPEAAATQTAAGDATLAGLRIAKERGMEAPAPGAAPPSSPNGAPSDEKAATEATKDEPAPGPSANVPAKPKEPETDPDATDSKT
jgi:NADH-quinone oxidoreductase subunit E